MQVAEEIPAAIPRAGGRLGRAAFVGLLVLLAACTSGPKKKSVAESRARSHYQLALRLYQEDQVRPALQEMTRAVDLEPDNAVYRNTLGFVYFSLGEYERAREHYEKALRLDPAFTEVHLNLALVDSEEGNYTEAEAHYRRALADPSYPTPEKIYVNWGLTQQKRGDASGAEAMMRKALEMSPRYPRAHYELARLLETKGDPDTALQEYLKAWEGMSEVPELNLRLGEIYTERNQPGQARPYLEKVITVAPQSPAAEKARHLLAPPPAP